MRLSEWRRGWGCLCSGGDNDSGLCVWATGLSGADLSSSDLMRVIAGLGLLLFVLPKRVYSRLLSHQ